jgi:hypothetical protein
MFAQREARAPNPVDDSDKTPFVDEQLQASDPQEETKRRHAVLMECLADERDRQQEERLQAAIDEDFYDHLQYRREDAAALLERGQAPLVYNESRQTIDWTAGTQKRMRKDHKILGREKNDMRGAEVVTQVVKYTDEVNLTQWHRSRAFKQAALSGLGWLEEGVNPSAGEEIIYSGSEDWRNVYRDSRAKRFDLKDARYLFRRKRVDLDYAMALLPKGRDHLRQVASSDMTIDENDIWYLGERLTGASDIDNSLDGLPGAWRDRRAYIGGDQVDQGRRTAVDLIEAWYTVPTAVQVFDSGPLDGQVFNPADPGHQQLQRDRHAMYDDVKLAMRAMVCTEDQPMWDGRSPFNHDSFLLIPVWGYRRYRDGMTYGLMRGMRDLQEDINKRASKALWLLSSNRIVADKGAVDDVEEARAEAARADGYIEKTPQKEFRFENPQAEVLGNLQMMDRNTQFMRDIGGVTNANLGRGASGQSGISVERQQDQGSLTTSELFDNLLLATKLAGQLRLSHIKQFKTKASIIRIVGDGQPVDWMPINQEDPDTGEILNDLAAINCDFIVAEQDYRESYIRAATAEMFELLGQIATFAPQVVMSVLDLAVEGSEVRNKDEWVARIRKLNGQRDPTKEVTPEEAKQQRDQEAQAAEDQQVQRDLVKAQLAELQKKVEALDVATMAKKVDAIFASLQAAQVVATTPGVAPVADVIAKESGFQSAPGTDPNVPEVPPGTVPPQQVEQQQPADANPPQPVDAQPQQLEGIHQGIETPTGADNGPAM